MLFRDLVQGALKEGRLKFSEKYKAPMDVDVDPLQIEEAHNAKPIKSLVVEALEGP